MFRPVVLSLDHVNTTLVDRLPRPDAARSPSCRACRT